MTMKKRIASSSSTKDVEATTTSSVPGASVWQLVNLVSCLLYNMTAKDPFQSVNVNIGDQKMRV